MWLTFSDAERGIEKRNLKTLCDETSNSNICFNLLRNRTASSSSVCQCVMLCRRQLLRRWLHTRSTPPTSCQSCSHSLAWKLDSSTLRCNLTLVQFQQRAELTARESWSRTITLLSDRCAVQNQNHRWRRGSDCLPAEDGGWDTPWGTTA